MKLSVPLAAMLAMVGATAAFADTYTVYVGNHVIGTCSDKASCKAIRKAHPGFGEQIVNDATGRMRNFHGRHHKDRDKDPK
jgi:hypothetical protein